MQNACHNKLTVSGPQHELDRFVHTAEGPVNAEWVGAPEPAGHSLLSFPRLVPPGDLAKLLPWWNTAHVTNFATAIITVVDLFAGGEPKDGCMWQLQNWGTEGVHVQPNQRTIAGDTAVYEFTSDPLPPLLALDQFASKWPQLRFRLQFLVPQDHYGEREYADGELVGRLMRDIRTSDCKEFSTLTGRETESVLARDDRHAWRELARKLLHRALAIVSLRRILGFCFGRHPKPQTAGEYAPIVN